MHFVPTVNGLSVFYNHAAVGTLCRVSAICDVKAFVLLTGNVFVPAWADEIHFVPTVNGLSVFYNHVAVGTLCRVSAICAVKTFVSFAGWKPNGSPAWGSAPGAQHT